MNYVSDIVMCQHTYEPICFKLGMMLNTTKLQFDSSLNDFDVHPRSQGSGKIELVQSFCCKVAWSNSNAHDGWLCKEDDGEEVLKAWQM